jgi:RNA polymerase sigma-70 factor (ECF subfamily)
MRSTELAPVLGNDAALVAAIRSGDEDAFAALVDAYSPILLRVAMTHVPSHAVAEEVVQETWIGVMRGVHRYEGRSPLKSWIIGILRNTAKTRGERERRSVPFSSLAVNEVDDGPILEPERFLPSNHSRYPGHWAIGPTPWPVPEEGLLAGETMEIIEDAIRELPPAQRAVISLRDVEGWPSHEVCEALEVSPGNQRVLLHRARTRVRAALESYFGAVEPTVTEA